MWRDPSVVMVSGGDTVEIGSRLDFDDFYRAELPRLVALARALCGAATADDVAQEAMLAAYRRWRHVGEAGAARGVGAPRVQQHGRVAVPAHAWWSCAR